VVTEVGKNVSGFASGDRVGVGCMVNTCRTCESCEDGAENYCSRMVLTYNSRDRDDTERRLLRPGRRRRALRGPLPRRATGAPLLCAGATVYAPMRRHGLGVPCKHVGGLGHVAVRFGRAFGAPARPCSLTSRSSIPTAR
jgi:cinnamyl-alcohol dehydrogenase